MFDKDTWEMIDFFVNLDPDWDVGDIARIYQLLQKILENKERLEEVLVLICYSDWE
jgi:hypothetical protein